MSNKYELTKEKILQMANESDEVKKSLKKAFPDVFEDEKYLELPDILGVLKGGQQIISLRIDNEYKHKAFWLNKDFNWEIKEDSKGKLCLIPTKK